MQDGQKTGYERTAPFLDLEYGSQKQATIVEVDIDELRQLLQDIMPQEGWKVHLQIRGTELIELFQHCFTTSLQRCAQTHSITVSHLWDVSLLTCL